MKASGGIVSVYEPAGPATEDDIVAAMACALAEVDGHSTSGWGPVLATAIDPLPVYWTVMKEYVHQARKLRAAYIAMRNLDPRRV